MRNISLQLKSYFVLIYLIQSRKMQKNIENKISGQNTNKLRILSFGKWKRGWRKITCTSNKYYFYSILLGTKKVLER